MKTSFSDARAPGERGVTHLAEIPELPIALQARLNTGGEHYAKLLFLLLKLVLTKPTKEEFNSIQFNSNNVVTYQAWGTSRLAAKSETSSSTSRKELPVHPQSSLAKVPHAPHREKVAGTDTRPAGEWASRQCLWRDSGRILERHPGRGQPTLFPV